MADDTPRWVKVSAIIIVVLLVLLVILHLTGGVPRDHTLGEPNEQTRVFNRM
jgi:hypothetical protein